MQVHGWSTREELTWLCHQASQRDVVFELGAWHGRSSLVLSACRIRLFSLDTWSHPDSDMWDASLMASGLPFDCFVRNTCGRSTPIVIDFRNKTMVDWLLKTYSGTADMVYVDADHTSEGVRREVEIAKSLAKDNALICGHDYGRRSWPDVAATVHAMFEAVGNPVGSIWVKK